MVRHADTEMIVIREEVYPHRTLEERGRAHCTGPSGEALGWVRRQKESKGEHGPESLLGFL